MPNRCRPAGFAVLVALPVLLLVACTSEFDRLMQLAESSLAQVNGEIQVPGLAEDVEIRRDEWGVPHIYAQNVEDLFFAQGFVAAQDRLWQLEMWRRVGEGRLSEIAGPQAFERDRLARLLRYRGDMEAEWASYHPDAKKIVTAFVNGVNAFINHRSDDLPVEFKLTGIAPEPWTPEVPLLRMAGLPMTQNATDEVQLAASVADLGVEEANRRDAPDPPQRLQVAPGLDVAAIPNAVLQVLRAGYAPLPRIDVLPEYRTGATADVATEGASAGSNNWVVSGSMTETGLPILANDPHRRISLPSLRYLVHLNAPGWNVIGAGEPALPGVAIGHNERIAWGLTIVGIDQQDIYVEEVNPRNPNEVRWGRGWEALRAEVDTIWVKDEGPREVVLKFSRHGPVLYEDSVHHRAYVFRSVLAEPGTAGYLGSLRVDQAHDWDSFLEALNHWLVPSENMVYADVDGNIGWQAAGLTPVRCCGWVGRLPVPGAGRYEWRGFRPMSELPRQFNPARGFIATANHNIMPDGYASPLGYQWASPRRYERIYDVLADSGGFSVQDFERLQYDEYSSVAASLLPLLRGWTTSDRRVERARQMLRDWNAVLDRNSPAAALFKIWQRTLPASAVYTAMAGELRDSLVQMALAVAIDTLESRLGRDWGAWRWGALHKTYFEHPVIAAFDLAPVERGGDGTTVNVTGQSGASFREIIDVSQWDASVATSTPGQSGQPGSPHYDDLLPLWRDGRYFPLLYSREAVERATSHRLLLRPASEPAGG